MTCAPLVSRAQRRAQRSAAEPGSPHTRCSWRSRICGAPLRAAPRAGHKARTMTDVLASKVADPKTVLTGSSAAADHTEGMSYLETLPRRLVSLYLPLSIIMLVLLFPFYWMALTAIKPDEQLLDLERFNPFWTWTPTLKHVQKLLFETNYPQWLWNTMFVAIAATFLSIVASVLAAYAIVRLRYKGAQWVGASIFLAPIWCRRQSCSFRFPPSSSSTACS